MKRIFTLVLCIVVLAGLFPQTARAEEPWPENVSIEAEGGIVIDADTGAVLYGKNIHTSYFPASITKILTALIVIENCDMDEMVTFSHNAVYNVEAGSSSAGLDEGDVLSVKDCLYAMMLKSANEAANALAEHVAGTTEAFAEMMNEKAASLGCQDSHFANPSGLNHPEHYTSAYDMALIGQAAVQNPVFMEIDSTLYYDLPVTKRNPEGARIYPGHRMLKQNMAEYYPYCIGGKTGYTSLAGNTLVTFARKDGMTLVSVVLNGHQTHYTDTRRLLDFGFDNFRSVSAAEYDTSCPALDNDMTIAGMTSSKMEGLSLDADSRVTIPASADFSSVTSQISFDLDADAPDNALAQVSYQWGERRIGSAWLILKETQTSGLPASDLVIPDISALPSEDPTEPVLSESDGALILPETAASQEMEPAGEADSAFQIPAALRVILAAVLVLILAAGIFLGIKYYLEKKEAEARMERRRRRLKRLEDGGISSAQFDLLMEQRRSSYTTRRSFGRRRFRRPRRRSG